METQAPKTSMSSSLLAREVFAVCFPQREGMETLRDPLSDLRRRFFTGGKKTVKAGKAESVNGYSGKIKGKLSGRRLYWKKTVGSLAVEESFDQVKGSVVVRRDLEGNIASRVFFDRSQIWIKSEYYDPWDLTNPAVIFKPVASSDLLERFDWDADLNRFQCTELHPLPYERGTAEESILSARFGDPPFLVSVAEGDFCYCTKKEAQERLRAREEIKDGTVVLMPAWQVRDGSLNGEEGEEKTDVSFTSLEEYAKVGPEKEVQPETAPAAPPEVRDTLEFSLKDLADEAAVQTETPTAAPVAAPSREIPEVAPPAPVQPVEPNAQEAEEVAQIAARVLGEPSQAKHPERVAIQITDGKMEPIAPEPAQDARSEPEEPGTITVVTRPVTALGHSSYEGEYVDGKREGFGSHFDKNGNLSYAGSWKQDRKDGLGVSFRGSDHALHIARWEDGKPGDFVTLFDKDGNLRYSGKIIDGKKQGAGVSVSLQDGTFFVGKWENGEPTGFGSSFDSQGNLLYYGNWKNGKRDGHGTEFDANGSIIFDGEWKDGKYHNGILYQRQTDPDPESDPDWD